MTGFERPQIRRDRGLALTGQTLAAPLLPPDTTGNLRFVPFEVVVQFKPDARSMMTASQRPASA